MSLDIVSACTKRLSNAKAAEKNTENDGDDGYAKSESNQSTEYHTASSSSSSGFSSNRISMRDILDELQELSNEKHSNPDDRVVVQQRYFKQIKSGKDLDQKNFLQSHTEHCDADGLRCDAMENFTKIKISVVKLALCVFLRSSGGRKSLVVKLKNNNKILNCSILHMFWIDLYKQEFLKMDLKSCIMTFEADKEVEVDIPREKFDLGKRYKLVVYYKVLYSTFCNELVLQITSRPSATMKLEKMGHYFPQPELRTLDRCRFKESAKTQLTEDEKELKEKIIDYGKSDAATRLNRFNYYSMAKIMLQLEDEVDSKRSLTFDQHTQSVALEFVNQYSLIINNKRLEEAINEYTRIWITPMSIRTAEVALNKSGKGSRRKKQRIYGSVVAIKANKIYFELKEQLTTFTELTNVQPNDEKYFIRFMNDRTSITLEHRALDFMNDHQITHFFFPDAANLTNDCRINWIHPSSYSERQISWTVNDINEEQKSAVINILNQTSFPFPYILFGPPGTGKTKTLIEAVSQIIKNDDRREAVLVCATSNAACNEVVNRLLDLEFRGDHTVFRIFSKTQELDLSNIPKRVLATSNLKTGEHYYPSLGILYKYKVIVCTLTTAGRLSQGKIDPYHFSHIFIDEAGCATESQLMIAIAGLCSTKKKIHANIIFAGDPKQLGPVIKSQRAVTMGYDVSTLERLIATNSLYMRNDKTNKFNDNYVTQLKCNYRSHSSILHVSNSLYYNDALKVHAPESNINWFYGSDILMSPMFPMIFHSVKGVTVKVGKETSPYNELEIDMVVSYLKRIFATKSRNIQQGDIGIISPYRKQCEELVERCQQHNWNDIQIGAVEVFQGQEKPIIIVSTVRSQMNNIGFLNSKKRLNVLLTRAKCLLIIIGDAETLAKDEHWKYLIDFCKANNSLVV